MVLLSTPGHRSSSTVRRIATALIVALVLVAMPLSAAASPTMQLNTNYYLTGDSGGALTYFHVVVPPFENPPVITATFTPSGATNFGEAGFRAILNGTPLGLANVTSPGVATYTMPPDPAGTAIVEVFNYNPNAVGFTLTVNNVPAGAPNGPARGNNFTPETAVPIHGTLSGTVPGNTGGAAAYYTFPDPGGSPPTIISMTYGPANATVEQAVGFSVYDPYNNQLATTAQTKGQNSAAGTIGVVVNPVPGEQLTIVVFNYGVGIKILYRLSVSGIAPPPVTGTGGVPAPPAPPAFTPFWVQNFVVTNLWSGPDSKATSFGPQPQYSYFQVVQPQSSSRLYILDPKTNGYAYIDASAVGPSGPPPKA